MKIIRITYLSVVAVSLIVHLAVNSLYTAFFLGLLIAMLIISCIIYGVMPFKPEFKLDVPDVTEKNRENTVVLQIKNKSFLPLPFINCKFLIKNNATGEINDLSLSFSEAPFGKSKHEIFLKSSYCGGISFAINEIILNDFFGFVSRRVPVEFLSDLLVFPNMKPVIFDFKPDGAQTADNDEYYECKTGNDISEPTGFRDYISGDPLRSIHWKLSQKTDGLVIREGGLPKPERITIIYETGISPNTDPVPYELWDTAIEALSSVSCRLNDLGLEHTVIWHDNVIDNQYVLSVKDSEDTGAVISKLMMSEVAVNEIDGVSYCRLYNSEHMRGKIIYITTRRNVVEENMTVICAVEDIKASDEKTIFICPDNYKEILDQSAI